MVDTKADRKLQQALQLVYRLERISVDSYWAHRAGGLRVALLRTLDRIERQGWELSTTDKRSLEALMEQGYWILVNAAKEL